MLFQLIRIHIGINKVVNNKKNIEIPSIPKVRFKFKFGNQKILVTNWKLAKDFWKKIHKNSKPINGKNEKFKAINFKKVFSLSETINSKNTPIIGESKI